MSGIYGIASLNKVEPSCYSNLIKWNDSYGNLPSVSHTGNTLFMGIKPESFKNSVSNSEAYISKSDKQIGVADCLIYSAVKENLSDEQFLFNEIKTNGIDIIADINGDFAGAIWNESERELLLFRDHLGVRPLYYYKDDNKVIFSSDIRGITSLADVDTSIDENWIYYNTVNIFRPSPTDTEYKLIKCVPPGGYISFSFVGEHINSLTGHYWIPGCKKYKFKNRKAYSKELRKLVEDAVKIRATVSAFPIGAELSGGLDSGVIALLLANMKKDCFYYSWSPSPDILDYAEGDERLIIKDICDKANIKCNYGGLSVSFLDHNQIKERYPLIYDQEADNMAFPYKYAFPSFVNTTEIYETAATMQEHNIRLVFCGHSGDEGISHRSNPFELVYNHEFYRYLRLMFSRSHGKKHRFINTLNLIKQNLAIAHSSLLKPIPRNEAGYSILNKDFIKQLNPKEQHFLFAYDPKTYIRSGGIRNRFDVVSFYSAAVGIRYLFPFADYRLIDFALGIPRYLYHSRYLNRFVFREAFKDLMPKSLYNLREKENTSYRNLPQEAIGEKKPDMTDERFVNARREILNHLNKSYWERFLDYSALESWILGKYSPQDDESIMRAISKCFQVENVVKRSREVNTAFPTQL
ncbi:asparagine synthase (glutamine-hydrolysing) [Lachnospiraceae bacterium YSD2013]|nr:asparagine synthase (glutamine-hydrolysing) [Lachnospiraceae bacterium YSD2013]